MLSINRVIKFLWVFSLLLFTAALFYGYYLLPDAVCIKFDNNGSPLDYTERKNIFYLFTTGCALFNIILLTIESLFRVLPVHRKAFINKKFWLKDDENKIALNFIFSNWLYGFAAILNFCILLVFYVFTQVNLKFQANILNYQWVWPVIVIILAIYISILPVRLTLSKIYIK